MKIIEMLLGDSIKYGIEAISLVDKPAINEDWIALKEEPILLKSIDKEKRILLGAVLVPDRKILRIDKDGNPYYIFFSADTIEATSQDYAKKKNLSNVTQDHKTKVEDVTVVETWLKVHETNDKSVAYGMDLPVGTWFVAMKVDNDEVWNEYVKSGAIKGFSIEGYFTDGKRELSEQTEDEKLIEQIKEIIKNG